MSGTREECVFMARLAEQAERHEDMVEYMKRVAMMGTELNLDERNLLSVAYKNSVGTRRRAWREVSVLEHKEADKGDEVKEIIKGYRLRVEEELHGRCLDILGLLENLIPLATGAEAKVFWLKLKGDYYRYLSEAPGDKRNKYVQDAHDAYEEASKIATVELPATHEIRLGLALNFSVFYFEVFGAPDKACKLAEETYKEAMKVPDGGGVDNTILELLRDNLTLWTHDMHAQGGAVGKPPDLDGTEVQDL